MARDLVKIGRDGFAIVDKCFGKGKPAPPPPPHQQQYSDHQLKKCQYQYYHQQATTHQVIQVPPAVTHKVIEYHEAPRAGDCHEAPRSIDCNEAAHLYGGTLLVDYSKRNQHRLAK